MTSIPDPTHPADDPALTPALQWIANLMRLSALCHRAKCNRAQACRGEPRLCLMRHARLVPDDAREGVKALVEGAVRELDFDAIREESPAVDDLLDWRALVDDSEGHTKRSR